MCRLRPRVAILHSFGPRLRSRDRPIDLQSPHAAVVGPLGHHGIWAIMAQPKGPAGQHVMRCLSYLLS